jgi:hypothetical protein
MVLVEPIREKYVARDMILTKLKGFPVLATNAVVNLDEARALISGQI